MVMKDLTIREAFDDEYNRVRKFYHDLIDAMSEAKYHPMWEKNIYPTDDYLQESIKKQTLFIGEINDSIVGAMVINHDYNESYEDVSWTWTIQARNNEISVIHILCVHPNWGKQGIGRLLVQWAIDYAKNQQQKAVRLDVLKGNLPAERLYLSVGFKYIDTISMYYDDTGWTDFELYEYII